LFQGVILGHVGKKIGHSGSPDALLAHGQGVGRPHHMQGRTDQQHAGNQGDDKGDQHQPPDGRQCLGRIILRQSPDLACLVVHCCGPASRTIFIQQRLATG
jgi:hypothetical protein